MRGNFVVFFMVLLSAGMFCCEQKKAMPSKNTRRINILAGMKAEAVKFQEDERPDSAHLAKKL